MFRNKTDDELRGGIIAAGGMDEVHALEEVHSRDTLASRADYRAGLVALASKYNVGMRAPIAHRPGYGVLPYGPAH